MIRVFPVIGPTTFSDDFEVVRREGGKRHGGIDIMADEGAPLVAVDDGQARFGTDPLGGNVANLYAQDGTRYYYAHLSAFEGNGPRDVNAGEVIGYVGSTGNAAGGPSHVHFEEHPGNGPAVNPHAALLSAPSASLGPRDSKAKLAILALGVFAVFAYALASTPPQGSMRRSRA